MNEVTFVNDRAYVRYSGYVGHNDFCEAQKIIIEFHNRSHIKYIIPDFIDCEKLIVSKDQIKDIALNRCTMCRKDINCKLIVVTEKDEVVDFYEKIQEIGIGTYDYIIFNTREEAEEYMQDNS